MSSPLVLPVLAYPFGSHASPFASEVDEACYRWGDEMGIYYLGDAQEYRQTKVGWLAAYTSPHSTVEGLRLLADWQMWLFAFDDGFCDESECGSRPDMMVRRAVDFLGVLEGGQDAVSSSDPFLVALADLSARLGTRASGAQRARFVSAVNGYLIGQCWEAVNRAANTPPQLDEYVRMRRHTGAVRTCTALADVACGFELSAEDYEHADVVALTDMAVNVACWANDVLSYPKEMRRSQAVHSLPALIRHWRRLEPQAALEFVARMHDDEVRRYLAAEEKVLTWAGPALRRYLGDLRSWMVGNLCWSQCTGRYQLNEAVTART